MGVAVGCGVRADQTTSEQMEQAEPQYTQSPGPSKAATHAATRNKQ